VDESTYRRLNALLVKWDALAEAGMRRVNAEPVPSEAAFYHGTVYGIDRARDDLAAVLVAIVKEEMTRSSERLS
jgi:hypothetical protein